MPAEFWGALFGLVGSAIGSVVGIVANSKMQAYRLEQLEKKVDKHNNLVERTFKVENEIDIIKLLIKEGFKK